MGRDSVGRLGHSENVPIDHTDDFIDCHAVNLRLCELETGIEDLVAFVQAPGPNDQKFRVAVAERLYALASSEASTTEEEG